MSDLQHRLANIVEKAIQDALVIQANPQGLDDITIDGLALNAAESMAEQFDILPKGELEQEWLIPTHRAPDGRPRGNITFSSEEEAVKYRDEWLPNGEIWRGWWYRGGIEQISREP